jgi:WD40 repeat protein
MGDGMVEAVVFAVADAIIVVGWRSLWPSEADIKMRRLLLLLVCGLYFCGHPICGAQVRPLRAITSIPMPGVRGRIDHMSIDVQGGRLFVSALGNHTLEVIDLHRGKVIKTLTGLREPQGVLYVPGVNKIFVDSAGDGTCKIFDGTSYRLLDTIKFPSDADDIRYDLLRKGVYVGYGDQGNAGIGIINPATDKVLARIPLPSHPEAFSLEESPPRIFINIPSAGNMIAVADRRKRAVISRWTVEGARENFPMAIDRTDCRLFVVTRSPARLIVYDINSGRQVASFPCVGVADDAYYDSTHKLVLISGGDGFVDIFKQDDPDHYSLLQHLKTSPGARTSIFTSQTGQFYLAIPYRGGEPAEVRVYQIH